MTSPGWRFPGRPRPRQHYSIQAAEGATIGDFYNLASEADIVASGVRDVFTPHQPIQPGDELLAGRRPEIRKLMEVLNTPGQHALLYGARGVGKSSLANAVASAFGLATTQSYFEKRCDHTDTFESIFREPLAAAGVDVLRVEYVKQVSKTHKAEAKLLDLSLGGEAQAGLSTTYRPEGAIGASDAARHLATLNGFMLIDELDVVEDKETRHKIAELIKQLSDLASHFKLLLVGIAETAADLTGSHPSVQRSLRETQLQLLPIEKLREIVLRGGARLRLDFTDDVATAIAQLSAGYPHFTHLLALKCAENSIRTHQQRIDRSQLPLAMSVAVEDAEGTLRDSYATSVRSQSHVYEVVMTAAASLDQAEFTISQLRTAMPGGEDPARPLRRLASDDESRILRRTARGVYRFTDPRMRSYIRIIQLMVDAI